MLNPHRKILLHKSPSLESLNLQTSSAASVLTSTRNPEVKPNPLSKLTRRMAIIPTPNRPVRLLSNQKHLHIPEEDSMMYSNLDTDIQVRSDNIHYVSSDVRDHSSELLNVADNQLHLKENMSDRNDKNALSDSFICNNFTPFSGTQPINEWLDETESQFNRLNISRSMRFKAIPLLVQGEAKRIYIRNRRSIESLDDFYELLLNHFDMKPTLDSESRQACVDTQPTIQVSKLSKLTTISKANATTVTDSHDLSHSCTCPVHYKTITDDTKNDSQISKHKSALDSSSNENLSLDSVIPDLRKAIVSDFIKNPKLFRGNKDDVTKWLEEIEHIMQIAHVPESNRLDLIAYSLRGDALQWFRNNKSELTIWNTCIQEIKKAFRSSFCEEVAFKTLESYSQSENQSVRNFYNEVLKLCKQADSNMSDSIKLG